MLPNYLRSNIVEHLSGNGKTIVRFYNDTSGTLSRGAIKVASPKFIAAEGVVVAVAAPATQATDSNIIGIVIGDLEGATTVADATYGLLQIEGPFGSLAEAFGVPTTGTVAANDGLQVLNAAAALIDSGGNGGAVLLPETVAIAIELVTTDVWAVYLLGKPSSIEAT